MKQYLLPGLRNYLRNRASTMSRKEIFGLVLGAFCVFAIAFYSKFIYTTKRQVHGADIGLQPDQRENEIHLLENPPPDQSKDGLHEDGSDDQWSFNDDVTPRPRFLVYSCSGRSPCGGWGDRLRGIVSTYIMSLLTNRMFVINMTSPCPLAIWLRPNEILWNQPISQTSRLDEIFIDVHDNKRFLDLLKTVDLSEFFINDVVRLTPNYDLFSRLKLNPLYEKQLLEMTRPIPGKPVSLFTRIYERLFVMNHDLQFQVSQFLGGLYETERRRTLICAQIRMGRNPSIPSDTEIKTRPSEVKAVWKFLQEYKGDKRFKIFVTTDSQAVREKAKTLFSSQILDTSGPVSHPDYRHGKDSCMGLGKIILDQYLLKFCDTLVISKSLYGVIGAHLRGSSNNLYQFGNGTISRTTLNTFRLFNF